MSTTMLERLALCAVFVVFFALAGEVRSVTLPYEHKKAARVLHIVSVGLMCGLMVALGIFFIIAVFKL